MTVVVGVTSWIMPTVFAMLVSCEVGVGGYLSSLASVLSCEQTEPARAWLR